MPTSSSRRLRPARQITLDHVVLEVADPVRSVEFYRRILGLRPVRVGEFKRGGALFPSGRLGPGTVLDFFGPSMWRSKAAGNPHHLSFRLSRAAVAALERRLAQSGIAIKHRDDHNFGARGWGCSIYFSDPDGITLEARFYPAANLK